ncbi:MAG: hypothetical protein EZS28_016331 [Streblomastix strix]|uniref:CSN8/PSMD8/EIF3K domain-containing protein n=1 Tax=Streblomastix strix TaxID=222440 RepID=A0A5J4VZM9_9EUKA|nr:MAG: hypothetical protein EZS28_016331 [Streblomastix strix]
MSSKKQSPGTEKADLIEKLFSEKKFEEALDFAQHQEMLTDEDEHWAVVEIITLLALNRPEHARAVYRRNMGLARSGSILGAIWEINLAYLQRNFKDFFEKSQPGKLDLFSVLLIGMREAVANHHINIIERSCTSILLEKVQELTGYTAQEATTICQQKGWQVDKSKEGTIVIIPEAIHLLAKTNAAQSEINDAEFLQVLTNIIATAS